MAWWGWIAAGALLLTAELGLVNADFYLVFLGISALVVGGIGLAGLFGPLWLQWSVVRGDDAVPPGYGATPSENPPRPQEA